MKIALLLLVAVPGIGQAWEEDQAPINRLLFGGDVMLSRYVFRLAQQQGDAAFSFREIAREFASADLAFVNLESPFAATGPYDESRMVFRAHPSMIEGLKYAGIDVVSTANNHARDAGSHGIEFTLRLLEQHGIKAVGTALRPEDVRQGVVLERKGVRFGFLAYTADQRNGNHREDDSRIAMLDEATLAADIQALRKRCDVVIVSMHAGWEYWTKPNAAQIRLSRAAIDAGASVVAGHHPHTVQPVEWYKQGVIFYSLGNLVFDQTHLKPRGQGILGEVIFAGNRIVAYQPLDLEIHNTVPKLPTKALATGGKRTSDR
jgi:poly-gamma-glutamate synthesis protein (capsule biosynthesis protein)